MNPAVWYALALIAVCVAGLVVVAWRLGTLDGNGGHTHRNVRRRAAAFADPADRTDPDGEAYVAQLRTAGRLPYVANGPYEADDSYQPGWLDEDEPDAGWWAQQAPPDRVEILPELPRRQPIPQLDIPPRWTPPPAETVKEVLGALQSPDTGDDGDGDTTRHDLHAVLTWDGKTPAQLAADLAAKYLTAEVPQ